MERRRSIAVLCVLMLLVGGLFAGASAARKRSMAKGDFLTASGSLLGPPPGTLDAPALQNDTKIHVNAKITCAGQENGDHLHIHSGNVHFRATVITGGCSGDDKEGSADGSAMGFCDGGSTPADAATANFSFSTSEGAGPSRQPTGGDDFVDVSGLGCDIFGEGELNVKFHDQTPDPAPSNSTTPSN